MTSPSQAQISTAPTAPKKSGCGCFAWGCLGTIAVLILLVVGSGVAFWYGVKTAAKYTDPVILWTYQNVARPKVIEMLPPHMDEKQKKQVLTIMDSGVEKYVNLSAEEKKLLLKEIILASYYLSQDKVIPPEKIPNLSKFIKQHIQSQTGQAPPF